MPCMICKTDVSDNALICPNCGAMPWKMPDTFLSREHYEEWQTKVYNPQRKRWNHTLKREQTIQSLLDENEVLKKENHRLTQELQKSKNNISSELTITPDGFVIRNGILTMCHSDISLSIADIPNGVICIGENSFKECMSLTTVIIPESVEIIGFAAFSGCGELSVVNLSEGLITICDFAFEDCVALNQIILPTSLNFIGNGAFFGCESLAEITIPSNVINLGEHAFGGCYSLSIARVPSNLAVPYNCFPTSCKIIRY